MGDVSSPRATIKFLSTERASTSCWPAIPRVSIGVSFASPGEHFRLLVLAWNGRYHCDVAAEGLEFLTPRRSRSCLVSWPARG